MSFGLSCFPLSLSIDFTKDGDSGLMKAARINQWLAKHSHFGMASIRTAHEQANERTSERTSERTNK